MVLNPYLHCGCSPCGDRTGRVWAKGRVKSASRVDLPNPLALPDDSRICSRSSNPPHLFSLELIASRFQPSTDIASQTQVKSSISRSIRAAVLSQWKIEPETLEAIWPKKEGLVHVKWLRPPYPITP